MIKFIKYSLCWFLACCVAYASDQLAIQKMFNDYKVIVKTKNENRVPEFVDPVSLSEFERYLNLARTANRSTIESLMIYERIIVLSARHILPNHLLKTMSPNGFIIYEDHSSDQTKIVNATLKNIKVSGNMATADSYYRSDKKSEIYFIKENGQWKINLIAGIAQLEDVIDQLSQQKNMPVNDVILLGLELIYHKKASANIWDPIQ